MRLYEWQAKEIAEFGAAPKRAEFVSPRCGKTLVTLESMRLWGFTRGIVCAPLVVCPQWAEQLDRYGYGVLNLYSGPLSERRQRLAECVVRPPAGPVVVVANYDALRELGENLLGWKPEAVIGDESHILGSPQAKRAKAFRKLAKQARWVRLLTGTPTPNHFGNLWGQLVCVNPQEFGTSYEQFARRFLIRDTMFPTNVLGHRNTEQLEAMVKRCTTVVRREDVFGADGWQVLTKRIKLPQNAADLYLRLVKEWVLEAEDVSANHVLKRMVRLQQLSAGYLPSDNGAILDVHSSKIDAVVADLGDIFAAREGVVLFHRFSWEGEAYSRAVAAAYPDAHVYRIDGAVAVEKRRDIVLDFERQDGPRIAIVQIQSGGVGISFAEATHAMFTSRSFSFVDDEQARDRVFKPGKARCVTYYEADRTVDQYIAQALAAKQQIHEGITHVDVEALAYGLFTPAKHR